MKNSLCVQVLQLVKILVCMVFLSCTVVLLAGCDGGGPTEVNPQASKTTTQVS